MRWARIAIVVLLGTSAGSAVAGEIELIAEYKRHDIRVTSFCIEGHVVVVAHSDVGKGGGLQMVQVQHEVKGKIVPMTCVPGPVSDSRKESGSEGDAK